MNPTAIALAQVAVEHFYYLVLEMFLWQSPMGLKTFNNTAEFAQQSATLAANQGLYNGFLAAGLVFSLLHPAAKSRAVRSFFLGCVVVAALYGAYSVNKRIFFVQGVPAIAAIIAICIATP